MPILAIALKSNKSKSPIAYKLKKVKRYRYMSGEAQKITNLNLSQRSAKITAKLHLDILDYINENYDKCDRPLKKLGQAWHKQLKNAPSLATIYNWLPKGVFVFPYEKILKSRKKRAITFKRWKQRLIPKYSWTQINELLDNDLKVHKN